MNMIFPKVLKVRQHFSRPTVEDVAGAVAVEMRVLLDQAGIGGGKTVGITVGSRGIRNIVAILASAARTVREAGATPVFLAAMGSHGGGVKEGQAELLASFGITEENVGAKVITCSEGREIGVTSGGLHAHMLDSAFAVDAIVPLNRVKTHTSFKGEIESGMVKKLVVGLGGPSGARQFHSQGKATDLPVLLQDVGRLILEKMPVIGGIAVVENAYEETAMVKAVPARNLLEEEARILAYSKTLMPSLPVTQLHALIVEEMGKNYSGTGMDTNIIGRLCIQGEPEPVDPHMRYLAVMDLSEESHGNAVGIGLADFTTRKLVEKIDRKPTYVNSLTATFPIRAKIPIYFDTEKEVLESILRCLSGSVAPEKARLIIIPNTLFLEECYISEALLGEVQAKKGMEIEGNPVPITFAGDGRIQPRLLKAH